MEGAAVHRHTLRFRSHHRCPLPCSSWPSPSGQLCGAATSGVCGRGGGEMHHARGEVLPEHCCETAEGTDPSRPVWSALVGPAGLRHDRCPLPAKGGTM